MAIAFASGGDVGDAGTAVAASKNAVENNELGQWIGMHPTTENAIGGISNAVSAGYLTQDKAQQLLQDISSGKFNYDPLREDLKKLPEDLAILVTPYGDYVAFRDADSWEDYAIAAAGSLPIVGKVAKFIKVGGKVVKIETKAGVALVDQAHDAYKAGNVAEGNRLMNQAVSQGSVVETSTVKAGKGNTANKPLDKTDLELQHGKGNVEQGGGNYKGTKDKILDNQATNQKANESSNFGEHVKNENQVNAGKGNIAPQGYNVDPNKFDYFFGKVTTGNPHNVQRSAQNLKDLNTLGIKTEQQLVSVFNKAASEGTIVSQKSNNFVTTITKSVNVSDKGAIQVSFFYPNGNLNATPKVTTLIPKLS